MKNGTRFGGFGNERLEGEEIRIERGPRVWLLDQASAGRSGRRGTQTYLDGSDHESRNHQLIQ